MSQEQIPAVPEWTQEVLDWIGRRRGIDKGIAEVVARFFANACREVHRPEEAWFGTNSGAIALVVGGIYLAAVTASDGIYLLVDEDLSPIDGVTFFPVRSTQRSKTPLVWLHSSKISGVQAVVDRTEVWTSFSRASRKIFDSPISGSTVSPHKRNGKIRLSELFGDQPSEEPRLAEEVDSGVVTFREGALRQITVNAYERNPVARQRCIGHYGPRCFVCGFDFFTGYGEAGRGVIHVHHLRQLSEIGEAYEVDPIADLRPVCANCHTIIHRRTPPYTVEEVQAMLSRRAG